MVICIIYSQWDRDKGAVSRVKNKWAWYLLSVQRCNSHGDINSFNRALFSHACSTRGRGAFILDSRSTSVNLLRFYAIINKHLMTRKESAWEEWWIEKKKRHARIFSAITCAIGFYDTWPYILILRIFYYKIFLFDPQDAFRYNSLSTTK